MRPKKFTNQAPAPRVLAPGTALWFLSEKPWQAKASKDPGLGLSAS